MNVTIDWPEDADAINYFTVLSCPTIGEGDARTVLPPDLSYTIDLQTGSKMHQETRAVYLNQTSKVIKVADFVVGDLDGPKNIQVEPILPSVTTDTPLVIYNQTVESDPTLCFTRITWALGYGTGGKFNVNGALLYTFDDSPGIATTIHKDEDFYDEFQALDDNEATPMTVLDQNDFKVFDGTVRVESSHS